MQQDPVIWDKVEWRQGDGRYRFEVAEGGLHATMHSPHGKSLTIPMVAWYGLLDALAASRKTKDRSERPLPARFGARWSGTEVDDLVAAFQGGSTIAALARAHNRSEFAVESQLAQKGLWDRISRQPMAGSASGLVAAPVLAPVLAQSGRATADPTPARDDSGSPWPPDFWDTGASLLEAGAPGAGGRT